MSLTSAQIRQSFLDFFRDKEHSIVPSSSLLPDSPNLLFTNAGMNQFVPIFLGERKPDVHTWPGAVKGVPTRAADTQKCIRAGGKHNDLDDVGLDTYHHTFFEMLGNWSFGDYFKKEAIEWAWELVVERWKFPAARLYATIYQPGEGDPSERDQEAWDFWAAKFRAAGLDPAVHIVNGNKKDNFWMMGETGPCGPCSELHVDLTPAGDTKGALVNAGDPRCIEIWNLVFIQFNANPDGTFTPLPAKHVDTGMGFERVTSIIQGTKGFTDFTSARISNYETDIFRPIFDEIEKLSGRKYGSTLPGGVEGNAATREELAVDVAFRVIADHIRTLSFAIADGIQPGNTDRHYVLRRILRRAVRYGRTLGFREPFFYRLAGVLAETMGDVFPEIRVKRSHVEEVIRREEEAFNKTLDKGIELFEREAERLTDGERGLPARTSEHPARASGARYWKRRLPHYERPHGIYHISFSTRDRRTLLPAAREIVLNAVVHFDRVRYELFAACVMPDHVHCLLQPWPKGMDENGQPIFWGLSELIHSLKSFTATKINKEESTLGQQLWENEYHDRLMRSDADVEEKFEYICRNPWTENVVGQEEPYPWLWTWDQRSGVDVAGRQDAGQSGLEARAPRSGTPTLPEKGAVPETLSAPGVGRVISGGFAFKLYDTYGFPLDLTELMARERGLAVDTAEFERLMDEQRDRARRAQKKQVIELSEIETKAPTQFLGYDHDHTGADVQEVLSVKGKIVVIANNSVCYAEMGGQVGDTGEITGGGSVWRIANTRKSDNTWLHFLEEEGDRGLSLRTSEDSAAGDAGKMPADATKMVALPQNAPLPGDHVTISYDRPRRDAIQRHHTVTHLLHWALHEVVSRDATQKGSFVGPEKLTFDFNSPALTPQQVRDIERLVNERIVENCGVSWTERPYAEVRGRGDIMQFFGDKYGETVRVVQIGGSPGALDGYSMELCAGTHTRSTGEIGLFRIAAESAIAAGVRRIEAMAGLNAYELAAADSQRLQSLAGKMGTPLPELEKRIDAMLAQQKELEKALKAAQQREAASRAKELLGTAETIQGVPVIVQNAGPIDGDALQTIADSLKGLGFKGVVVLGGTANGAVGLTASVSPEFTSRVQAGKIIQAIAPIVGGKGGGKPDNARGGGKDPARLDESLAEAKRLLGAGA
jgi:alanyl-tRNA synthetase/REP element-mobilizing transposase RayT